jgi:pimeloyl-ACP methyl ester carboxylesterase
MLRRSLFAFAALLYPATAEAEVAQGRATNGMVELAYWVHGAEDDVPIVIINGQGAASRPGDALTEALAALGFRAIYFDNRDSGRSTILRDAGAPPEMEQILAAVEAGETAAVA